MAQPTAQDKHVDAVLTEISVAYMQDADAFVAGDVFPEITVDKQSDFYYIYDKEDWFRDEVERLAPNSESAGSGYNVSTDTYRADVYGFHKDIDIFEEGNEDDVFDARRDATEFVSQRFLLKLEKQWASDFFTTGVWDTDVVGGTDFTQWDDDANSDPVEDVEDGRRAILSTTGFMPNTMVLGWDVFRHLKNHPDIRQRLDGDQANADQLANIFDVDDVMVARAIENTANEGGTASYSFVHGKNAFLAHVAPTARRRAPSAGYSFAWTGVSGLGTDVAIQEFEIEEKHTTRIEGIKAWDNKQVATDLGYFFSGAVS